MYNFCGSQKIKAQEISLTETMTFLTFQTMQMLSQVFSRNASEVALSSSIRHAFILSCNFSTIYLDLSTVLQGNAILYFILGLCIRQNRKLEKINRNGFWSTNEYLFPGNLFDSSAESFFNFSYHTNAWLVFFSKIHLNQHFYLTVHLSSVNFILKFTRI